MCNILEVALKDKNLTPLEFRTLFYIVHNIDNVYLVNVKKELEIKTNGTMSKIVKKLIKSGYISRKKKSLANKKGQSPFFYTVNTTKKNLPTETNLYNDSYFNELSQVYKHFVEVIKPKKINEVESLKNIRLLIHVDKYKKEYLFKVIDYVKSNEMNIRSINGLRKYLKYQNPLF